MEPIDLAELRNGFRGRRYAQLVEHHVRKLDKERLLRGVGGTLELLPEPARPLIIEATDDWNKRIPDAAFWRRDCASVFDEIIEDMTARLASISVQQDDEMLFNMFQIITMNFAYAASDQPEMRRFMGIRKSLFRL